MTAILVAVALPLTTSAQGKGKGNGGGGSGGGNTAYMLIALPDNDSGAADQVSYACGRPLVPGPNGCCSYSKRHFVAGIE